MTKSNLLSPVLIAGLTAATLGNSSLAQEKKVTYDDDILPILRSSCLKCHNPDKLKGDLDLSTFGGALKGGGSGVVLTSGDPMASKLIKSILQTEEPTMPPNGKLADKDVETIKRWIAGGLLETSGSKAIVSRAPKVDMSLKVSATGKPDGPPPMPGDLLLETVVHTERGDAITGLANSPWAPLYAVGGQKQILLYNSKSLDLLGVLPYPEGYPSDIKFSRSGKLLVVGGGHGSKAGQVVVWDVTKGTRLLTVGDEFDSVLASDISADQGRIALGGPSKVVKIFTTKDGEVQSKIKKHTDWITALEFSPDGQVLASGDRNGGLFLWEAESGQEIFTLNGHKSAITSISWRADSEFVASSSEDGTIKVWQKSEGKQVNTWNAHSGGVLSVQYSREGQLVSCGRDNKIMLWTGEGKSIRSMEYAGELPIRARFSDDGARIVATDWAGQVLVWNTADGKRCGELDANPPTLAERIVAAGKRVDELQAGVEKAAMVVTAAEADVMKAEAEGNNQKGVDAAKEKLRIAKEAAEKAAASVESAKSEIARLKAGEVYARVYEAQSSLAGHQADLEKLQVEQKAAKGDADKATADLAIAKKTKPGTKADKEELTKRIKKLGDQIKTANARAATAKSAADKLARDVAVEKIRVDKMTAEYERTKAANVPVAKSAKL